MTNTRAFCDFWIKNHGVRIARELHAAVLSGQIRFRLAGTRRSIEPEKPIIPFRVIPTKDPNIPEPYYRAGKLWIYSFNSKHRHIISNFSRHPAIVVVTSINGAQICGFWRRTHRGWLPVDWRSPLLLEAKQRDIALAALESI